MTCASCRTSLSAWAKDLVLKRALYEDSGVPSYWVVDPDEPSLLVLGLLDGGYVETARATGADSVEVTRPFAVRLSPADLLE